MHRSFLAAADISFMFACVCVVQRGTLNGLMMTFGSVGNALGPIVGSFLYAAALNWPPPTDGRLVFVIGALIIVCIGVTVGRFLMPVVAFN